MGSFEWHEQNDPHAPGDLDLVRIFANTIDNEHGVDRFATPETATAWLTAKGLLDHTAEIAPEDVERLVALRESLHALLDANHDATTPDASALATLRSLAARAPLALGFDDDGRPRIEPGADGVDAVLGRLLAAVAEAEIAGVWKRLKSCRSDTCRWAFYDESKNQSRTWCSMAVCGNREKARRHRAKQKT